MGKIYIAFGLYALYVIIKFGIFFYYDKKLRERASKEKKKIQHRKIRVRESRPDRSSFPF